MRSIFKDEALDKEFRENGYVILKLPDINYGELWEAFNSISSNITKGFYASLYSNSDEFKKISDVAIKKVLLKTVKDFLTDYTETVGNFMVKPPQDEYSKLPLHQDWNIIEETEELRSMNVWVPMMDIESEMGRLHIMKESHKLLKDILRGSTSYPTPLHQISANELEPKAEEINVPLGYACFMDHALVHFSPPNKTETVRVCASLNLRPSESRLVHYNYDSSDKTYEKYLVDDDFFLNHKIGTKASNCKLLDKFKYEIAEQQIEDFKNMLFPKITEPESWIKKVVRKLGLSK